MDLKQNTNRKSLTDLAKWAAFSVQIIGYFPLSSASIIAGNNTGVYSQNAKAFRFTWKGSFLPYYSSLLTAASFSWCLVYFLRYHEFASLIEFKSATEVAAYNLMIFASTLSALYIKIFALAKGKQYQNFLERTQFLLANFDASSELGKIKTSCGINFLLMLIPVIGHVAYFQARILLLSITDDWAKDASSSWTNTDTQLYFGLTFWTLFALLHVGNGIWLNFFVKIYTKCLKSIAIDLKNLNGLKDGAKNFHDGDLSKLYNDNIDDNLLQQHEKSHQTGQHDRSSLSAKLRATLDKLTLVDHEIARFNDFFGNMLLLQVGNCVMNLLVFSFFACLWMGRGKRESFVETLVPMYLYGKELLDLGTAAEQLSFASEEVLNSFVEDVELGGLSEEMFLKIQLITVQLCTKPPIVSARQFFTINRSLVTSVMSALATFLVVLVQFRDQDVEEGKESVMSKVARYSNNSLEATTPSTVGVLTISTSPSITA